MSETLDCPSTNGTIEGGRWQSFADQVLAGNPLTAEQAAEVLTCPDSELLSLLDAAYRVRRHYFGNQVQLYLLMNAKSGLCPEDCSYCSQSKESEAEIPKYNILNREKLLDGARVAKERDARTYCIVISARGPNEREMKAVETIVPEIKEKYGLHICACLGLLTDEQAQRLKACGVDRVNHNLNTGEEHYDKICTTHTFADRVDTLKAVREAGLEMCSGGIVGMGESNEDLVGMAIELRELGVHSIPVNFLIPIEGVELEVPEHVTPQYCLKTLAMFRLVCPDREIRIAGGRELHLRSLQPLGLYAANSIFVGDYLTTKGQAPDADYAMIKDLGFEIVTSSEASICSH
ncbi:Biotin synthase [Posidoniimonas polymericola]|uniref:Biotin synthase n=1 Tax=Posidoniimonas polymericola TaxID=2528002 RepID=A0A5C5XY58_9BACT|nr:biotin synthase BioB [Posidoniimonas polymericola]TWT66855.1 Biotin synthase [Posidoniimonas polymericola]